MPNRLVAQVRVLLEVQQPDLLLQELGWYLTGMHLLNDARWTDPPTVRPTQTSSELYKEQPTGHHFVGYRDDVANDALAAAAIIFEAVLVNIVGQLQDERPLLGRHVDHTAALVVRQEDELLAGWCGGSTSTYTVFTAMVHTGTKAWVRGRNMAKALLLKLWHEVVHVLGRGDVDVPRVTVVLDVLPPTRPLPSLCDINVQTTRSPDNQGRQ